jgi:hypothetical protein
MLSAIDQLTPNLLELYIEFLATRQINAAQAQANKDGTNQPLVGYVAGEFFNLHALARGAFEDLNKALYDLKHAAGDNKYAAMDDDAIARDILERLKLRRVAQALKHKQEYKKVS